MRCIKCGASTEGSNYCQLHKNRSRTPRPGVASYGRYLVKKELGKKVAKKSTSKYDRLKSKSPRLSRANLRTTLKMVQSVGEAQPKLMMVTYEREGLGSSVERAIERQITFRGVRKAKFIGSIRVKKRREK